MVVTGTVECLEERRSFYRKGSTVEEKVRYTVKLFTLSVSRGFLPRNVRSS